jgi:hypothetical protein
MPLTARRYGRLAALGALLFYCGLLLASSIPAALAPGSRALFMLQNGSGFVLHLVGVTPGVEVFRGQATSRAIPKMSCFRVVGEGTTDVVLYDDMARCRERRIDAIRDPFRIFQMSSLSAAFVDLNLSGRADLTQDPTRALFLFSDYYCHTADAERTQVRSVRIDSVYIGTNLDDGTTGEIKMAGQRRCDRPTWKIR